MPVFGPTRAALAAAAARGADILPSLRLVLTAEALTAPPPSRALELNAELDALCAAVRELADCRAGWLYFCPAYAPLPAAVPRALLQGTVLTFLRGVLRSERRAAVRLAAQQGAAVLALQGGDPARMPGDLPALLHRCGAYVTATGSGPWAAAASALPRPAPARAARPGRSRAGPLQRGKGISGRALRGGCGIKAVSSRKREKPLRPRSLGQLPSQGRWPSDSDGRRGFFATRQRECFLLYSVSFPHASHAHTRPHKPNRPMPMPVSRSGRVSIPRAASNRVWGSSSPVQSRNAPVPAA